MANPDCPLCSIPTKESLLYEDDDVYMVPTVNMKGHEVRVMVCIKRHDINPSFLERTKSYAMLIDYMERVMKDEPWYIVDDTYASIPDHWHLIACDSKGTPEELALLEKTPKVSFHFAKKKIMVGIPAYNEQETIGKVIKVAKKYGDVVVLDDGSTDNTALVASTSGAKCIFHPENRGYGQAIASLFYYVKKNDYEVLVTLDADGQHNPDEIPKFINLLDAGVDVVIGNRFQKDIDIPDYRRFGVKLFSRIEGFQDSQCGFRAYNRKAIESISIKEKGMGASLEILEQAKEHKLTVAEIPVHVTYKGTKHSQHPLEHGASLIQTFLWFRVWRNPFTYLGIPSLLFFLLGLVALSSLVNLYLEFHTFVLSWGLLAFGSLLVGLVLSITTVLVYFLKRGLENLERGTHG